MDDYPNHIEELDLDSVQLAPAVVEAAQRFARAKPWRGNVDERKAKFRAAVRDISSSAGVKPPAVIFDVDERVDSGRSCYLPWRHTIILRGRLSVITTLHEVAHVLFGASERIAVTWSLVLFRECFPRSFANLTFRGHMARPRLSSQ